MQIERRVYRVEEVNLRYVTRGYVPDNGEYIVYVFTKARRKWYLMVYPKTDWNTRWQWDYTLSAEQRALMPKTVMAKMKGQWINEMALPLELPKRLPKDPHKRDLAIISYALRQEAARRDWCSEYEDVVQRVNPHLAVPMVGRGGVK